MRLFSLEKSRLRGDLFNAYQYLQDEGQEDGARLFPVVSSTRTKVKDTNLNTEVTTKCKEKLSSEGVGALAQVLKEAVESTSLRTF